MIVTTVCSTNLAACEADILDKLFFRKIKNVYYFVACIQDWKLRTPSLCISAIQVAKMTSTGKSAM